MLRLALQYFCAEGVKTMSLRFTLIACFAALLLSCGQKPVTRPEAPKPATALPVITGFTLQSPGFPDNGPIPDKYTGKGQNLSPALHWYNPPVGTQSFVLIVDDPDAPSGTFTHWVVYDIPRDAGSIPEGAGRSEVLAGGGRQVMNDFRRIGYDGPMPPPGKVHHYRFSLYALDTVLNMTGADRKAIVSFLGLTEANGVIVMPPTGGHILGRAVLIGTYRS